MDNQQPLAELLTTEQGKSLAEAKGEIAISAAFPVVRRGGPPHLWRVVPSPWPTAASSRLKQPVGVVAAITPWNFPSSMLARKLGPALAAGCTAVVKPASQTPYSALALGVLAEEAGFPKGVVNIVTGSAGEIGDEICANPLVRKLTFTGSTEVGKMLIAEMRLDGQEGVDGAGRQRAVHRLRRRRRRPAVEGAIVAKFRNSADLRLHQPLLRAGRRR